MIIRSTALFIDERLQLINEELGDVENNIEKLPEAESIGGFG